VDRRSLRAAAVGALATVLFALVVVTPLLLVHRTDLPLERKLGGAAVSLVAKLSSGGLTNPRAGDRGAVEAGRSAYTGSCASCHGGTGEGDGVFGTATYPVALALTSPETKEKSDAELFWITKNGLSFTAMPAFAKQYADADIWALVAYVRALQRGQAAPLAIPTPTAEELAFADPFGDTAHRGAAVYFAQGCAECHGAVGNAPGELALRRAENTRAIRGGARGMPAYGTAVLSDRALADLVAYVNTFSGGRPGR